METPLDAFITEPDRTAVIVDFDGTLAEIVDDPEQAVAVPHAEDPLLVLSELVAEVAIVSGRPLEFLRRQFPHVGAIEVYGIYGVEREIDGAVMIDARVVDYVGALNDAEHRLRAQLPDLRIENKHGFTVTVHWRERPDAAGQAERHASEVAAALGLRVHVGRKSVELRAPVGISKASTVATIASRPEIRRVLIAGDDQADLEAFDVLERFVEAGELDAVFRVAVRSTEGPAGLLEAADLVVESPHEFTRLLGRTAAFALLQSAPERPDPSRGPTI